MPRIMIDPSYLFRLIPRWNHGPPSDSYPIGQGCILPECRHSSYHRAEASALGSATVVPSRLRPRPDPAAMSNAIPQSPAHGPLTGYRVLEMGSTIAGLFCGRLLA